MKFQQLSGHLLRLDRLTLAPIFTAAILTLAVVAVATKPVAFMIPGALVAQVVLFTPKKTRSGYLRASALILIPVAYTTVYAVGYFFQMDGEWQAHTIQGDITTNVLVYIRNVTNIDFDGRLWLAVLLFAPVGASWIHALWRWGNRVLTASRSPVEPPSNLHIGREAVLVYLCAIFLGSVATLARAQNPATFYVLLPMFAFTASLATLAVSLLASGSIRVRRGAAVLTSGVAIGLLLTCWTNVTGQSRLGRWTRSARNLASGYEVLRNSVDPQSVESMTFYFPNEPFGYFYFFSDGAHQDIDSAIPSFVFRSVLTTPIESAFGEIPSATSSGELIAVWTDDLQLIDARVSGTTVYHNSDVPAWPPTYVFGETLLFQKNENGAQYLANGWSWEEDAGRWSDGNMATLVMRLDQPHQAPLELVVSGQSFVHTDHPRQDVEVLANEQLIAHWTFNNEDPPVEWRASIPAEIASLGYLKLSFRLLNPRSPASLGLSQDGRELGILLQKLHISALQPTSGDGHSDPSL